MFNGHTMSVITSLSMIGNEINNTNFITVAAITTSDYPQHPNIYNASILMPPTEILMAWADSPANSLIIQNEYPKYLATKDPDDMLVALIAALTKRNIILYIPRDEFSIYGMELLQYIYTAYGITCNFGNTRFDVVQSKIPIIITKFYLMDLMNKEDYIAAYPMNWPLPDIVIGKLAAEYQPFNYAASFEEYKLYFNQLNASKTKITSPSVEMVKIIE